MDTDEHKSDGAHAALTFKIVGCAREGRPSGDFVPDAIVNDEVIVDAKVIEKIGDIEHGQMLNYLRITQRGVGLILNFRRPKLEWGRIIL